MSPSKKIQFNRKLENTLGMLVEISKIVKLKVKDTDKENCKKNGEKP